MEKKNQEVACVVCGNITRTQQPTKKYCSRFCAKKMFNKKMGLPNGKKITNNAQNTFALSEVVVSAELLRQKWDVFRPLSTGTKYDLVCIDRETNQCFPIEVRTCYEREDGIKKMNTSKKSDEGKRFYAAVVHKEKPLVFFWDRKENLWEKDFRKLIE